MSQKQNHPSDTTINEKDFIRSFVKLQDRRLTGIVGEVNGLRNEARLLRASRSWRWTFPMRVIRGLTLGRLPNGRPIFEVGLVLSSLLSQGKRKRLKRSFREELTQYFSRDQNLFPSKKYLVKKEQKKSYVEKYLFPGAVSSKNIGHPHQPGSLPLFPKFLIIAELSLAQCAKYRVWQKKDLLESLGWSVQIVDWRDQAKSLSALQTCTEVIFYRVPGFKSTLTLVREAKRLGLSPRWEVDDLIFDVQHYRKNGNISRLSQSERKVLLSGIKLFKRCMLACGKGLASTDALAQAMRASGLRSVEIVENALDPDTLGIVASLPHVEKAQDPERIWICYGSGTNTHDEDFRQAEAGLFAAMAQDARLCLRLVGPIKIPRRFIHFADRIERIPIQSYAKYLEILSTSDISIAPLEETLFNDCKSNIKFVEASIVNVPSVCSPRGAFRSIMIDGKNGFLAQGDQEWCDAFLKLAADKALRHSMADEAKRSVLERYSPDTVSKAQVEPIYGKPVNPEKRKLRVLVVNVYFKPYSFGGATIIAEEMARGLQQRGVDVGVLTARPASAGRSPGNLRYVFEGMPVLSITVPESTDHLGWIDHPGNVEHFSAWLDVFRPDIVHIHALQGIGLSVLRCCQEKGVPYVLTLHDAWWLCDRQFMVKANGTHCFQTKIDLKTCRQCQSNVDYLEDRYTLMRYAMDHAALLLCPSQTQRQLYIANNIPPEKLVVSRNGFVWPKRPRKPRRPEDPVRFAYVGGSDEIKGYSLLRQAAEGLVQNNWSLTLVDNKLNLGYRSIYEKDWSVKGELIIVPGYDQSQLDAFYDHIDVLVFPSQWKESYGLTIREALSRDVWVITTSPGGQSEDVVDGVNGHCIPIDGRPGHLQKAMNALIQNPSVLDGYRNPLKDRLATFDEQADSLLAHLQNLVPQPQASMN